MKQLLTSLIGVLLISLTAMGAGSYRIANPNLSGTITLTGSNNTYTLSVTGTSSGGTITLTSNQQYLGVSGSGGIMTAGAGAYLVMSGSNITLVSGSTAVSLVSGSTVLASASGTTQASGTYFAFEPAGNASTQLSGSLAFTTVATGSGTLVNTAGQLFGGAAISATNGGLVTAQRLGPLTVLHVTLATGTSSIILNDTGAQPNDVIFMAVSYPASATSVLNVDETGTGTLLVSSTAGAAAATALTFFDNPTGSLWVHDSKGDIPMRFISAATQAGLYSGTMPYASATGISNAGALNGTGSTDVLNVMPGGSAGNLTGTLGFANTLWVDSMRGSDSNPGTFYQPFATFMKAVTTGTALASATNMYTIQYTGSNFISAGTTATLNNINVIGSGGSSAMLWTSWGTGTSDPTGITHSILVRGTNSLVDGISTGLFYSGSSTLGAQYYPGVELNSFRDKGGRRIWLEIGDSNDVPYAETGIYNWCQQLRNIDGTFGSREYYNCALGGASTGTLINNILLNVTVHAPLSVYDDGLLTMRVGSNDLYTLAAQQNAEWDTVAALRNLFSQIYAAAPLFHQWWVDIIARGDFSGVQNTQRININNDIMADPSLLPGGGVLDFAALPCSGTATSAWYISGEANYYHQLPTATAIEAAYARPVMLYGNRIPTIPRFFSTPYDPSHTAEVYDNTTGQYAIWNPTLSGYLATTGTAIAMAPLMFQWDMGEVSGSGARLDATGNGVNMYPSVGSSYPSYSAGIVTSTTGIISGSAAVLTGTNCFVDLPGAYGYETPIGSRVSGSITFLIWVKETASFSGNQYIASNWNGTLYNNEFELYTNGGQVTLGVSNGSGQFSCTDATLSTNTPYLLAVYVDAVNHQFGTSVNNSAWTTNSFTGTFPTPSINIITFQIGSGWNGLLQKAKMFHAKLTAQQLAYWYNGGSGR